MKIDLLNDLTPVKNLSAVRNVQQDNMLNPIRQSDNNSQNNQSIDNIKPSEDAKASQLSVQNLEAYAREKANDPAAFGDPLVRMAKKIGIVECQTCANRQYQDGSNDVGVSFKNGGHISPENAFAVVNSHEQEHVAEAKERAAFDESREFIGSSVRIFVSTCPECGRTYVSGGETRTIEGHASHSNSGDINLNNPAVAFYNQENGFNKSEGNLFDSVA
jgi:hypothetical protein